MTCECICQTLQPLWKMQSARAHVPGALRRRDQSQWLYRRRSPMLQGQRPVLEVLAELAGAGDGAAQSSLPVAAPKCGTRSRATRDLRSPIVLIVLSGRDYVSLRYAYYQRHKFNAALAALAQLGVVGSHSFR